MLSFQEKKLYKPERIKQLIEFTKSQGNQLYSSRFADDVSEV